MSITTTSRHGRLVAYRDHLDQVEGMLHIRDIVLLNAAAALYAGNVVPSLADGVKAAEAAIDSGKAKVKKEELSSLSILIFLDKKFVSLRGISIPNKVC